MKHTKFSRLFAAVAFVAVLALSGCKHPTSPSGTGVEGVNPIAANDPIIGTWKSTYSPGNAAYWAISTTELNNTSDTTYPTAQTGVQGYSGDNLVVYKISDTAGIIFIKYTISMNSDYTYSNTAPDVGKWYAVAYKNLTSNTVKICGAYKSGGSTSCNTLAEAVSEFTIANGYFGTYDDCEKL